MIRVEKSSFARDSVKWTDYFADDDGGQALSRDKGELNGLRQIGSLIMSDNERRKINQNYLHDKLLLLTQKDLDNQLRFNLVKIKEKK